MEAQLFKLIEEIKDVDGNTKVEHSIIKPKKGKKFTLEELQEYVEDDIEIIYERTVEERINEVLYFKKILVIGGENARIKNKGINYALLWNFNLTVYGNCLMIPKEMMK